MKYERYEVYYKSDDGYDYIFESVGPKGKISMAVQFNDTEADDLVVLSFGPLLPDGTIDDRARNNNRDRNKILATVAAFVMEFTATYRKKLVFFSGSTPARTRLYRMVIGNNLTELRCCFDIFGLRVLGRNSWMEEFIWGRDYDGFLVRQKNGNLNT